MGVSFHIASAADEAEIRRLLRENPVGGRYAVSLEREPDGYAGPGFPDERKTIILARDDGTGRAVGLCERVVRPAFVDGAQRLLPYLGALRVAASHRNRIGVLKGGFRAVFEHGVQPDELSYALTSIASDNETARRILTAGLKGFPRYQRVSDYVTFVMRPRRRAPIAGISRATDADLRDVSTFLRQSLARYQFAPVWSEAALQVIGARNILVRRDGDQITGCVAVWDQTKFKQVVARGYRKSVAFSRPLINAMASVARKPGLPAIGAPLRLVHLSAFAIADDCAGLALVDAALDLAASRGSAAAVLGMDARHPIAGRLRRTSAAIEYRTELFCVNTDEGVLPDCSARLTMPDVGLL